MATLIQSLQFLLAQKDAGLANETKRILLKEYLQTYTLISFTTIHFTKS